MSDPEASEDIIIPPQTEDVNATTDDPNDDNAKKGTSCHQCKSIKPLNRLTFCTNSFEKRTKPGQRKCRKKYCDTCLQKFYSKYITPNARSWICASCRGVCTCAACLRQNRPAVSATGTRNRGMNAYGKPMLVGGRTSRTSQGTRGTSRDVPESPDPMSSSASSGSRRSLGTGSHSSHSGYGAPGFGGYGNSNNNNGSQQGEGSRAGSRRSMQQQQGDERGHKGFSGSHDTNMNMNGGNGNNGGPSLVEVSAFGAANAITSGFQAIAGAPLTSLGNMQRSTSYDKMQQMQQLQLLQTQQEQFGHHQSGFQLPNEENLATLEQSPQFQGSQLRSLQQAQFHQSLQQQGQQRGGGVYPFASGSGGGMLPSISPPFHEGSSSRRVPAGLAQFLPDTQSSVGLGVTANNTNSFTLAQLTEAISQLQHQQQQQGSGNNGALAQVLAGLQQTLTQAQGALQQQNSSSNHSQGQGQGQGQHSGNSSMGPPLTPVQVQSQLSGSGFSAPTQGFGFNTGQQIVPLGHQRSNSLGFGSGGGPMGMQGMNMNTSNTGMNFSGLSNPNINSMNFTGNNVNMGSGMNMGGQRYGPGPSPLQTSASLFGIMPSSSPAASPAIGTMSIGRAGLGIHFASPSIGVSGSPKIPLSEFVPQVGSSMLMEVNTPPMMSTSITGGGGQSQSSSTVTSSAKPVPIDSPVESGLTRNRRLNHAGESPLRTPHLNSRVSENADGTGANTSHLRHGNALSPSPAITDRKLPQRRPEAKDDPRRSPAYLMKLLRIQDQKEQALRGNTPGVMAGLAGLPTIPTLPASHTVKSELPSAPLKTRPSDQSLQKLFDLDRKSQSHSGLRLDTSSADQTGSPPLSPLSPINDSSFLEGGGTAMQTGGNVQSSMQPIPY